MIFDDIYVGDTVGRTGFPYNFAKVIRKEPDLVVVERATDQMVGNDRVVSLEVIPRQFFDRNILSVYNIQEGEIEEPMTKQHVLSPAVLPQPSL